MKYYEALKIINDGLTPPGYLVMFEWLEGSVLRSDYFPDDDAGEKPIATKQEAWELAVAFAKKTKYRCCNIRVVDTRFTPVSDFHTIRNR